MKRMRIATFGVTVLAVAVTLDAQPIPQVVRTQQEVISEIVFRHLELGRMIQRDTPRHSEALRRAQAGQILCEWAIVLADDRAFALQVAQSCAALREQWPWLVEDCIPCRN